MSDPVATASLQRAVRDTFAPATAPRPQDPEEFYYDSDDSVLDLDEEYPELEECIKEWQATRRGMLPCQGGARLTLDSWNDHVIRRNPTCAKS